MDALTSFPNLSTAEFQTACSTLLESYALLQDAPTKGNWASVELKSSYDYYYLRITRELPDSPLPPRKQDNECEEAEVEEAADEEALVSKKTHSPLIHYDILLSPTYFVPVLYFHVSDPLHRFPPTMDTLSSHILAPEYIDQTKHVGVLGGITITDHPFEYRPVFFLHPCRTAEVMEASVGGRQVSPLEYLLVWVGAMGKSVRLDVPLGLFVQRSETNLLAHVKAS